jgi:glucose/arabinose dehydrogenase
MSTSRTRWPHLLRASLLSAAALAAACREPSEPLGGGRTPELTLERSDAGVAAVVPANFVDAPVVSGLASPTLMAIAPDGRIFVSEQAGRVRVIKNGVLLPTPFVTLSVNSSGERGALGIAFDPAFASNQFVYLYYTSTSGPHNRVSRFTASGDVASGGETILLDLPTLSGATNHNGGAMHFAPDGTLYVAVGDNANGANAPSLSTTLGKILRINADGTIPSDNPFFGSTTGQNQSIWAIGLRNPYTFAFQRGSGRLFINDVGQNTWEEINDGIAGANYGWPTTEGATTDPRFVSPFYAYNHSAGCAITGGDFYNPTTSGFPSSFVGDYFFADYCGGWIRSIDVSTGTVSAFATGINNPTDLQVGNDGALYYIQRGSGSIRKITYTASNAPTITQQPADLTVTVGAGATFTVAASGTGPLSYQWQRNQLDIPGATGATYAIVSTQPSDNGARFRVVVTNSAGGATSNEATLTVNANTAPTATITAPVNGSLFQGGETISFAGTGSDTEDGTVPAARFTWTALLFHDDGSLHSHPFYGPASGVTSGSFPIPTQGETSSNIWYRVYLRVTDSQGLAHTDSVDIQPRKANVTLTTSPAGLQLTLDGVPVTAPYTFSGVVGIQRTIEAVSPQTAGGQTWQFSAWSDGGAQSHVISTPAAATTYTASYSPSAGQPYEAESALLVGTVVATNQPGFTGSGYVRFPRPSGDYVQWTVNAAAAGTTALEFRYALGAATSRSLRVTVNGVIVKTRVAFASTGSGGTWSLRTVNVKLLAGVNTIRLTSTGTGGPNLDHLVLRGVVAP